MGVETSRRVDSSVRPATDRPDPSSTSSRQQQLRWPESGRKTGPSKSALGPGLVGRTDAFVGFVFVLSVPFLKKNSEERKTGVSRLLVAITFDFLCQINFFSTSSRLCCGITCWLLSSSSSQQRPLALK